MRVYRGDFSSFSLPRRSPFSLHRFSPFPLPRLTFLQPVSYLISFPSRDLFSPKPSEIYMIKKYVREGTYLTPLFGKKFKNENDVSRGTIEFFGDFY